MNDINKHILSASYRLAWKSFKKWWIPICIISFFIFMFEIVPRIFVKPEIKFLKSASQSLMQAYFDSNEEDFKILSIKIQQQFQILANKTIRFLLIIFPFVALLTIILLMVANWATKGKKERRKPLLILIYISCVHVFFAFIKLLGFFLFVFPGVYLYIKLLFVSLLMLEKDINAVKAVKMSWKMTEGYFWDLLLIIVINTILQFILLFTVIGVIPVTGFINTVRAAAFREILMRNNYC